MARHRYPRALTPRWSVCSWLSLVFFLLLTLDFGLYTTEAATPQDTGTTTTSATATPATSSASDEVGSGGSANPHRNRRFWRKTTDSNENEPQNQQKGFFKGLFTRKTNKIKPANPSEDDEPSNAATNDNNNNNKRRPTRQNPLRLMFARLKRRRNGKFLGQNQDLAALYGAALSDDDDEEDYEENVYGDQMVLSDSYSSDEEDDDDDMSREDYSGYDDWSEKMELMAKKQLASLKTQRQKFLDHIALISSSFLKKEAPATVLSSSSPSQQLQLQQDSHMDDIDDSEVTPQTDLSLPGRHFHIVTTAALPWMTGTAVNPLLRAAYLHRRTQRINSGLKEEHVEIILGEDSDETVNYTTTNRTKSSSSSPSSAPHFNQKQRQHQNQQWVTLVIPWLELEEDQLELYGQVFASPDAQEDYIRAWLADNAGMPDVADKQTGLKLLFYPARYHSGLRSIFAMGDMCKLIPDETSDVCVLEEPEHCNWYRAPGDGWTQKFHYVVGIVHTNYKEYASAHYSGLWTAPAIALISSAMVRAYCHQVIKLSDVLQTFAPEKEATSNVHGVRSTFLDIGLAAAASNNNNAAAVLHSNDEDDSCPANLPNNTTTSVYFIGKLLWAKGLDLLLEMQDYYKHVTGEYFPVDIYGSGPEQKAIKRAYLGRKQTHKKKQPKPSSNSTDTSSGNSTSNSRRPRSIRRLLQYKRNKSNRQHKKKKKGSLYANATKIFTSKAAFREHIAKIKESLRTEDPWRNIKESLDSFDLSELPQTFHEWRRQPIPATFPGRVDHASLGRHAPQYKIFVNPSISEVLCTTTAEALSMGKFAIIPVHPSNAFFMKFPNCLAYRNKLEFAANLQWALTHDPEPLTPELAHEFTWEAATDRFLQASAVTWKEAREREKLGLSKRDERIAWFLNELGKGPKGDIIRLVLGGGPVSAQDRYTKNLLAENNNKGVSSEDDDIEVGAGNEEEDSPDDEDEGLTDKFQQSTFVQALRATVANGLPSTMAGGAALRDG